MRRRITIELVPEHALQYATILGALIEEGPKHQVFQGMFSDLQDKLLAALTAQLTSEEVKQITG